MIKSESDFQEVCHALPYVIGQCAINLNANPNLPYSPYSDFGNKLNGASLLRGYLDLYGSYFLAFKRYKGWSKLGDNQAHTVMGIYNES